ncbi:hypothetical protein HOK51_00495 [Candidatus Woesearchaeota archaeon]|nr:hypothetical protein [Candidatus Woesearchaeota archaeon]
MINPDTAVQIMIFGTAVTLGIGTFTMIDEYAANKRFNKLIINSALAAVNELENKIRDSNREAEKQKQMQNDKQLNSAIIPNSSNQKLTATINDVQPRTINYVCDNEYLSTSISLISAQDGLGNYVFIKTGFDFVEKKVANIKFQELKNNKISIDQLIKLTKGQNCKYSNNEVVHAKGIVKQITYEL